MLTLCEDLTLLIELKLFMSYNILLFTVKPLLNEFMSSYVKHDLFFCTYYSLCSSCYICVMYMYLNIMIGYKKIL